MGCAVGALVGLGVVKETEGLVEVESKEVHQRGVVGALVGLAAVADSDGLAVIGDVVGAIVGLAVVGNSEGLAVVGYSEGLAVVGNSKGLAVGVLVGLAVGDAKELAFVGDDMSALVGAAGGSVRSTPTAITAAIIAAAATNPNETSPSLYFRILCSSPL